MEARSVVGAVAESAFDLRSALERGRLHFPLVPQHQTERSVMECHNVDDILQIEWRSVAAGRGPGLCVVAAVELPSHSQLVN